MWVNSSTSPMMTMSSPCNNMCVLPVMDNFTCHQQQQQQQQSQYQHCMLLPSNFVPGQFTITCGRGKVYANWPGNRRLENIVKNYLQAYSKAETKSQKSELVSLIMNQVQAGANGCAIFVRLIKGQWYQIDDAESREKVGRMLRDRLHTQYRSSSKAKVAKRRATRVSASASKTGSSKASNKAKDTKDVEEQTVVATATTTTSMDNLSESSRITSNSSPTTVVIDDDSSSTSSATHSSFESLRDMASHRHTLMRGVGAAINVRPSSNLMDLLEEASEVLKKSSDVLRQNSKQMSLSFVEDCFGGNTRNTNNDDGGLDDLFLLDTATTGTFDDDCACDEIGNDDDFDAFMNGDIDVDISGLQEANTDDSFSATDFDWTSPIVDESL